MTHAGRRLAQRYGVRRNADAMVGLLRVMILTGKARFRRSLHRGRSEWVARVDGRRVRVVWEEATETVVTVLPNRRSRRDVEEAA